MKERALINYIYIQVKIKKEKYIYVYDLDSYFKDMNDPNIVWMHTYLSLNTFRLEQITEDKYMYGF